jgi:hypothetical protein
MSIMRCHECETTVDTDFNSDHFNEDGTCGEVESLCLICDKTVCSCDEEYDQMKDNQE